MSRHSLGPVLSLLGRRGAFLLFLTLLDWVYGYSLVFPTPDTFHNPAYIFLALIVPLWVWGALWITVGTVCAVFAFRRRDAPGYAGAMFLKILWAGIFFLGWAASAVPRGYLSTAIWGAFAAVVALIATWPDPTPNDGHIGPAKWER